MKKTGKRWLSWLLTLGLIVSLLAGVSVPASADGNVIGYSVNGGAETLYTSHAEGWSAAVNAATNPPDQPVTATLYKDWVANASGQFCADTSLWYAEHGFVSGGTALRLGGDGSPAAQLTLDLNGCKLDADENAATQTANILIENDSALTIIDSGDTKGGIFGNKKRMAIEVKGSLTLRDVEISGNSSETGYWIKVGGVMVGEDGSLTVSGATKITGNTLGTATGNVYLPAGKTIAVDESIVGGVVVGGLTAGASIGVTVETPPTYASNVAITGPCYADYSQYFFSDDPNYEVVAEKDTNNLYTLYLSKIKAISVTVGENGAEVFYTTHAEGWNTACGDHGSDPVTVKLYKDWAAVSGSFGTGDGFSSEYGSLQVPSGRTLTLDLGGCELSGSSSSPATIIQVNGTLTLTDSGSGGKVRGYTGVYVYAGGSFTMEDGTITDCNYGVDTSGGGSFIMKGGNISDNTTGVHVNGGSFTMEGGEISSNTSYGVSVGSGSFTVSGAPVISGNGKNVYLLEYKTITIDETQTTGAKGLTEGASIGVSTRVAPTDSDVVDITGCSTAADYSAYFHSDNDLYQVFCTSQTSGDDTTYTLCLATIPAILVSWRDINGAQGVHCSSFDYGWNKAVDLSDDADTSDVKVTLLRDWAAESSSFGTGDGFSDGSLLVPAGCTLTLDLGGCELSGGSLLEVIRVSGSLTLTDSVSGGKVSGNTGVLVNDGSFTMEGGEISGNTNYGVFVKGGSFTVSGAPVISGNGKNVYLTSGKTITVGAAGLSDGVSIGVSTAVAPTEAAPVDITAPSSRNWQRRFVSDDPRFVTVAGRSGSDFVVRLAVPAEEEEEPQEHSYTVGFRTGGGTAFSGVTLPEGGELDLSDYVPTRRGYIFGGWYLEPECVNRVHELTVKKNTVLYAKWTPDAENPYLPFTDVKPSDWFFDDVVFVYGAGLMKGTGETSFDPYAPLSRGMLVTVLYRLAGEPAVTAPCPFTDVARGSYYEAAVTWAAESGIVNGYGGGLFGPEDELSREQLCAILYRRAGSPAVDSDALARFADAAEAGDYALSALVWAVAGDVLSVRDGALAPVASALRCEAAAALRAVCEG